MKKRLYDIRPELANFLSGAFVMIFEILGARIIAPYIGNSIFVWTSIISIVLGALALGYYYGGKIADKGAGLSALSYIFCGSALLLVVLPFFKDPILTYVALNISDIRYASIAASCVLLTPVSFLLGTIGPIATKLHIENIESSGKVIGRLGSIGTLGSIMGTLGAGFYLIPTFGIVSLLILLSISCLVMALICDYRKSLGILAIFILCMFTWGHNNTYKERLEDRGVHVIDTPYSHVTVSEGTQNGRAVKKLYIDNITHAGMFLNSPDLVHEYTKYYDLFEVLNPEAENMLMFGGAAYGYPKHFLGKYEDKNIDVVEIDAQVTDIAREHFELKDSPRLTIHHEDARAFLERNTQKYDAILGDAFGSYFSIPYQLTTLEAVQRKYDTLSENGVVLLNIINSLEGRQAKFLEAEYLTYSQIFPEVFVIPVTSENTSLVQNLILVAAKNKNSLNLETNDIDLSKYISKKRYLTLPKGTKILSDDYAPVDSYISELTK